MAFQPQQARSNQTNTLFGIDISRGLNSVVRQASTYISGVINPSRRRLENSGLGVGGERASARASQAHFADEDWRVRISLPPGNNLFYNDRSNTLLAPLLNTSGLIFPYTPQILVSHTAGYASSQPTHSNYPQYFYGSSMVQDITIQGDFTAQNQYEAAYVVAAITFLRSVTKMFWGKDQLAGTPPPVLRLNGYGDHIFNNIPVVVSQFSYDLSTDVDYINAFVNSSQREEIRRPRQDGGQVVQSAGTVTRPTRVPTKTSINVTLSPVYSREQMKSFGLTDFSAGRLIVDKNGSRGGFL